MDVENQKKAYLCHYLISDETRKRFTTKKSDKNNLVKFDTKYEQYYFPSFYDLNGNFGTKGNIVIDAWPAHASSRERSTNQIHIASDGHIQRQTPEQSRLPPVKKPRFLEMLEARINREKAKFHVTDGEPNPLRLQIYREIFTIFIQTCAYYGPLLARIKDEYESYLVHMQNELKKLLPVRELIWTVSQECEDRVSAMRRRENKNIKALKMEKKELRAQITHLQENATSLTCEVDHLTSELEKKEDEWRTEFDGRKLLITEVNELTSRLKEMEMLARAEVSDDKEDPIKLRIALDQAYKTINNLQVRVTEYESEYESQVPRTKYDDVKNNLLSKIEETAKLKEELESIQIRYDLLQEHCVTLNTYRDLYYIQVTHATRVLGTKSDASQKIDYLNSLFNKWRRLLNDKTWSDFQRLVNDEMVRIETGQTPVVVRSRMPRTRATGATSSAGGTGASGSGSVPASGTAPATTPNTDGSGSPQLRDSFHKTETN
ncbi:unnamed protein product [Trichobilharzia szidati]|nr:unnamed protein product [Trichobilharzia szidati]